MLRDDQGELQPPLAGNKQITARRQKWVRLTASRYDAAASGVNAHRLVHSPSKGPVMKTRARAAAAGLFLTCSTLLSAQTPALKPYVYSSDGFLISAPVEPAFAKTMQDTDKGRVEMHGYTVDLGNDF